MGIGVRLKEERSHLRPAKWINHLDQLREWVGNAGCVLLGNCGVLGCRRAVHRNRSTESAPDGQHQRRRGGSARALSPAAKW